MSEKRRSCRLHIGTQCMVHLSQHSKSEWVDATVIEWNSRKKVYTVRTFSNELFDVDRRHIKWTRKPGARCTDCNNESNHLLTKGEGILIGEALCPCCASLRGNDSVPVIVETKLAFN